MLNKKITLIFDNQKFRILNISVRIFQDLFLSLILFLFYNAEFLKICNSTQVRISNLAFINNINFMFKNNEKILMNKITLALKGLFNDTSSGCRQEVNPPGMTVRSVFFS